MKRLVGCISLVLVACLLPVAIFAAGEESGVGHLSLESAAVELGDVPSDTVTVGVVKFRNTGNAPLQILSIFSDCGCTSTSYPVDPVAPGEEGQIRISFNSKGRAPGPFRKVLRIRTDGDTPRVILPVKGRVMESQ